MPTIVWFRNDLRLTDNPALISAIQKGEQVIPVFVHSDRECQDWRIGSASRWWLHQSLNRLSKSLMALNSCLTVRAGETLHELRQLIADTGADCVFWNRRYEPADIEIDKQIKTELSADGIHVESFNGALLFEPWVIETKQGRPYQVFTPFSKTHRAAQPDWKTARSDKKIPVIKNQPASIAIDDLSLEPTIPWAAGMCEFWEPGEAGAQSLLNRFLPKHAGLYDEQRNHPFIDGTSRLSPHLHFGEISPRQIWEAVAKIRGGLAGDDAYLRQLIWRDFAHHILFHFPHTPNQPLRDKFARFPWQDDPPSLRSWQRGRTGYPIVDAGMRQLWKTGWMHNRVRMIVGSFLTKDLRISWTEGANWFWDTLVDADLANNTMGWQWVGGCGADAAPYFRVFNPTLQGQKFDKNGDYVREWIPEIAELPAKWIHTPWDAPVETLAAAGVELGTTYPHPIVDHKTARKQALEALATLKD
ncbi:UNVERIFIED_CONTAM: hypothetical protein GTU68_040220 [Idotea baltica]|nr:hypothetical protein [Idotea baltica]